MTKTPEERSKMSKIIKDKQGYYHTTESIKNTQIVLSQVKDGDVVRFCRETKDSGSSWASIIMSGKQWGKNRNESKSLLEYVNDGYDLKIIGHWQDRIEPDAFWNNIVNFDYDLIDLMELNKTIEEKK